ncbi:AraC-like transcriptional regulator QhpR [Xanthobacter sp. TB0136]|uniref:AraC-like transcriptional regulator QhpR n=1 Tax=Xanthobacter sp. TB0136 TaxID=3459177 RepID=UPI00403A41DB
MDTSLISRDVFVELCGDLPGSPVSTSVAQTSKREMVPLTAFVKSLEYLRPECGNAMYFWNKGEAINLNWLGELGKAISSCQTFGEALRTFVHGFPLLQSHTDVSFSVEEDFARFSYRLLDARIWPRRCDAELTLGLVNGIARQYAIPQEAIRSVDFEHQPDLDPRGMATRLGLQPRFMQDENAIVISRRALSAERVEPPLQPEPAMMRLIDQALATQRRHAPVANRVREQIMRLIGRESIGQEKVARLLGMSERTLRRSLAAEGQSFQELLDECRRIQGFALLVRSKKPMSEIALLLGYSDQTAFSRALSRLIGVSPRDLRKTGAEEERVIR